MVAKSRALINAPSRARAGEIVEIRAMVSHPMETGFRPDTMGRLIPRDIVNRFECLFEGEMVFAADLYPSVSANPYMAFPMRVERGGELLFRWRDDKGAALEAKRTIAVE
jgi:sulfur-oxidizing protein SoxZ